jgi:hypothetical protein
MKDSIQDEVASILQAEIQRAMINVCFFTYDLSFRAEENH